MRWTIDSSPKMMNWLTMWWTFLFPPKMTCSSWFIKKNKSSSLVINIHYWDFVHKKSSSLVEKHGDEQQRKWWWTFFCCTKKKIQMNAFPHLKFDHFFRRSAWLGLIYSLNIDHFWCVNSISSAHSLFGNRSFLAACWTPERMIRASMG